MSVLVVCNWQAMAPVSPAPEVPTELRAWNLPVSLVLQDALHLRQEELPLKSVHCRSVIQVSGKDIVLLTTFSPRGLIQVTVKVCPHILSRPAIDR